MHLRSLQVWCADVKAVLGRETSGGTALRRRMQSEKQCQGEKIILALPVKQ